MKFPADDLAFLKALAGDVVEASRVKPGERVGNSPPNTTRHTLIRPGGRACYPAVWVRDFSMSLESGLIKLDEIEQHYQFIKDHLNLEADRKLPNGAIIPRGAVPDHINFDGGVVFYPGTMSAGLDQGGEPFGILPPIDDQFEFIHIAHRLLLPMGEWEHLAFFTVPIDATIGGMATTSGDRRAVGFGFCDAVCLTGAMLFPSLLRYRAACEMGFDAIAREIAAHLVPVFADKDRRHGWLYAATGVGRQPDVWGTIYALHLNVLPGDFAKLARESVADAVTRGTITYQGAVRHLPTDIGTGAWEKVVPGVAVNTYQNGAYWHTPTGWLISALAPSHPDLARRVFDEYIAHLREQDFRRGEQFGAPWECFGKDGAHRQNAVYMTSVTLPLSVLQQLDAA